MEDNWQYDLRQVVGTPLHWRALLVSCLLLTGITLKVDPAVALQRAVTPVSGCCSLRVSVFA